MKTLFMSFILLLPIAASAQDSAQHQKDSLRTVIANSVGKEKLDSQLKLALLYFPETADDKKMDTLLALYRQINDEALRQGDIKSQAAALGNTLVALFNKGNYDEIIRLAPEYMEKTDKPEAERFHYVIFNTYFKAYLAKGDDNAALAEAKQIYDRAQKNNDKYGMATALFCMSDLYGRQERCDEQEKYLRQSIELLKELGDKNLGKLTEACFQLCMSLCGQQKYDEALQAAAEFEKTVYRYEEHTKAEQLTSRHNLYSVYVIIYMEKKDYDRAEIYCNKIDNIPFGRESNYFVNKTRAQIFNARKQYDKALQMADSAMKFTVTAVEQNEIREIKMQILAGMGRSEDLYNLAEEVISMQDSIRSKEFNAKLDELRTQYEVDKLTAQKERNRNYFLISLVALLLLAGILALYIVLYRQKKAAYQELVRKSQQWAKQQDAEKETDVKQAVSETDRQLFEQLQTLFQNKSFYNDATINIDELARRMKVNKNYLSQAINRCTGKNFNTFINEYRIKEAVLMMSADAKKFSLEGLAFDIGFNDRRTFYNAFKKMTGLSPSEFQNNL